MIAEIPPPNNYRVALDAAWTALAARRPSDFAPLGASSSAEAGGLLCLPVLNSRFVMDLDARRICACAAPGDGSGPCVGVHWSILALHYLLAPQPVPPPCRDIAFEDIPDARGYAPPYRGRVVGRFCATVGRTQASWLAAAASLGGKPLHIAPYARVFEVFPLVTFKIVWFPGDDELPSGASFLYQDNLPSIMNVEDIVVASEQFVSRLCGKPW